MSNYPTATELLLHRNRVARRDAIYCQNRAAEHRLHYADRELELELRLRSKAFWREAIENSRRYNLEARCYGFRLP